MLSAIYSSQRKNDEGFTLIELLIVVIIIGILAAIALPIFIDQQKVAIDASVKSDVRNTVTNVTNAQAAGGTAIAAVSGADTKIALTAVAAGSAASATATTVTATKTTKNLTNVPDLGDAYTVDGWNAGGSKFIGTAAKPAFEFSSDTGKFTQGTGAAPGTSSAGGSAPGGSVSGPGVANDTAYSGTSADFSFNGYMGQFSYGWNALSGSDNQLHLSAGLFSANSNPVNDGPAFLHGLEGYATGAEHFYDANNYPSKVYDKNGQQLATADCNFNVFNYGGAIASTINPALTKNTLSAKFDCALHDSIDASGAADLTGGRLEFTDRNDVVSSIPITGAVPYTP